MGDRIPLSHGAELRAYTPTAYKSKRYQSMYCCAHCHETLSGRSVAYRLWLPWTVPIPARDNGQIFFDLCSEEHARLWLDEQTRAFRIKQEEQEKREQALASWYQQQPDRACIDCKEVFSARTFGY